MKFQKEDIPKVLKLPAEPFWGKVYLTIENGSFTSISFIIRDSSLRETFTGEYKKHYEGEPCVYSAGVWWSSTPGCARGYSYLALSEPVILERWVSA